MQIEDTLSVPTQYDNDGAFEKPTDNSTWVRFSVMFGDSTQTTLGSQREFRTPGIAHAAIHAPLGLGDKAALEVADAINAAFRSITVSGIVFTTPRAPQHQRDGAAWVLIVQCPFHVDDTQS